jgi:hypothetical protein
MYMCVLYSYTFVVIFGALKIRILDSYSDLVGQASYFHRATPHTDTLALEAITLLKCTMLSFIQH